MLKCLTFLIAILSAAQTLPQVTPKTPNSSVSSSQRAKGHTHTDTPAPSRQTSGLSPDTAPAQPKANTQNNGGDKPQPIIVHDLPTLSISKNWEDWVLWGAQLSLAIVGLAGVKYAAKTLKVISEQAVLMKEQLGEMKDAGETAKTNAEAAKRSADAALKQIEVMIAKERARLVILFPEESADSMTIRPNNHVYLGSFKVNIKNIGGTPAFNIRAGYEAFASEESEPPASECFFHLVAPENIEGNQWEQAGPLEINERFAGREAPTTFYVYLRGFIEYNDVFQPQINRTRFLLRREFMRSPHGWAISNVIWEKVGTEADNEHHNPS